MFLSFVHKVPIAKASIFTLIRYELLKEFSSPSSPGETKRKKLETHKRAKEKLAESRIEGGGGQECACSFISQTIEGTALFQALSGGQ